MYKCPACGEKLEFGNIDSEFACPSCDAQLISNRRRVVLLIALMFCLFALVGGPLMLSYGCLSAVCLTGSVALALMLMILLYLYLIRVETAE